MKEKYQIYQNWNHNSWNWWNTNLKKTPPPPQKNNNNPTTPHTQKPQKVENNEVLSDGDGMNVLKLCV